MSPPTPNSTTPAANKETTRLSITIRTPTSTKKSATTHRRQSRRRARTVGRLDKQSNTQSGRLASSKQNHVVDYQAEPDLLEAGMDDWLSTAKTVGPSSSPAGTQQHQPSKKVTANKEDQPRDGKTTSTSTCNQTEPTVTTTTSRAT